MKLWLVRHARPLLGPGICYGASDIDADASATAQAAHELAACLPAGLPVLCSPLARCVALAEALAGLRSDLPPVLDARLSEMHFGCWEGVRWDDIPRAAMDTWIAAFFTHRFGGVESVQELMWRVDGALRETFTQRAAATGEAVWITHAGVVRAAGLLARGVSQVQRAEHWPRDAPGFGQWVTVAYPKAGTGAAR